MPDVTTATSAELIELPDRSQRGLFHSDDAEAAVLGGLLLDNGAWLAVSGVVTSTDFFYAIHRAIFEAIAVLIAAGNRSRVTSIFGNCQDRSAQRAHRRRRM